MPTIINFKIKMAICAYPAPAARSEATKGNATKPGIKAIQPTAAAITIPNTPESVPRSLEIVCPSKKVRITPIKSKIASIDGNIFSKDRHTFSKQALFLPYLSQTKSAATIVLLRIRFFYFFPYTPSFHKVVSIDKK